MEASVPEVNETIATTTESNLTFGARSASIAKLATALAKAQAEIKNPPLDSTNPHFTSRYASLAAIRDAVTPSLSKNGLAVTQLLSNGVQPGEVVCETILLHESGEYISSRFSLKGAKVDAQGCGSAATYARRYSLAAIISVVGDEDDDGNAAAGRPASAQQQTKAATNKQAPPAKNNRPAPAAPAKATPPAGNNGKTAPTAPKNGQSAATPPANTPPANVPSVPGVEGALPILDGVEYEQRGNMIVAAGSGCFNRKDQLKGLGFRWHGTEKAWVKPGATA